MDETIPVVVETHPLNGVTLVKCATPRCQEDVRASKEVYCAECRARQAAVDPEASP